MQKIIFIYTALLVCFFGCQSTSAPQWLTPSKEYKSKILGQVSSDDPFLNAPMLPAVPQDSFVPMQESAVDSTAVVDEAERERIKNLATASRENIPEYLKPLNPWNGPFENRVRTKNLEQDIVRQAGYDQVSQKIYSDDPVFEWEKEAEPKKGFDWSILDPANTYRKMRDLAGLGPDAEKASEEMQKGKEILLSNPDLKDRKKSIQAANHFMEAAKRFPDSVLEEDALHLAGECFFFADDYPNAFLAYQKLLIKYQHSKHVDSDVRRLFKIAQYWELESEKTRSSLNVTNQSLPRYDTFGFAKKAYETIFMNDPNGPVSDDALMALATAYLKRGRYQGDDNFNQAAYYYQRLREDHPLSRHLAKAYEQELFARTQAYMGAEHPNKTLEEAGKLAEITLQQFSGELGHEEKADILDIKEDIIDKEAERLWSKGQFWDTKKRYYGSARGYYEQLINDYPQTVYAEKARKRMVQIEGLPDTPPLFGLPINPFKVVEE